DGRRLRAGELLSIDFAVQYDGLHADAAITVPVADVDDAGRQLIDTTARALDAGIATARPGSRLGDIGYAVQSVARAAGYGQPDVKLGDAAGRVGGAAQRQRAPADVDVRMVVHLLGDLGHPVHHPDRGGEARQLGGPRDLPTVALPAVQSGQFAGDLVRVQQ